MRNFEKMTPKEILNAEYAYFFDDNYKWPG